MPYHKQKLGTNMRNIYKSRNGKFEVRLRWNNMAYNLGTFDTLQEAIDARDKWLKRHS